MSLRLNRKSSNVEMTPEEFRKAGHEIVDKITEFLESLPVKPVAPRKTLKEMRTILGNSSLPTEGTDSGKLLNEAAELLFNYSTFNGHPKFWGYITSSATPIGALADLLAAAVNPNVGAGNLSLAATEIEAQTIRWIAEMIGFPTDCGGIMVSGGNMANFIGFLAARKAKADWNIREEGLNKKPLIIYASSETHTWIQKAADLFGMGTNTIRWIEVDEKQRMKINDLKKKIKFDKESGNHPFIVVGNAGTVGTGATDPLEEISSVCKENNLWFHVDGAYGSVAAVLPHASKDLKAINLADSIALDPHKWLYAPLEAGCTLVRKKEFMLDAFSYHPEYYRFEGDENEEEKPINFYEFGLQNSRGFRALKVWLALKQAGKNGYIKMITEDIELAAHLFNLISEETELETVSNNLSITTFRYIPDDLKEQKDQKLEYLNELNEELLDRLQNSGEVYLSNAVLDGKFVLRVCIVNFRTTKSDIEALPDIVKNLGKQVDQEKRISK
ncbi:MAG: aminotransferase class V-fold PLP-dependent enzyme [Ignavibacteriaceae bacterium]